VHIMCDYLLDVIAIEIIRALLVLATNRGVLEYLDFFWLQSSQLFI
jgi:hypothetical protein